MAAGIDCETIELPLADGGEGTLDVLGGRRQTARVTGPLGEPVDAEWSLLGDGTAVIEMARASGLALTGARTDPLRADTRGVGRAAAGRRPRRRAAGDRHARRLGRAPTAGSAPSRRSAGGCRPT